MGKTIRFKKILSENHLLNENRFTRDHLFNMIYFLFLL